jgi:AcrR family transcriptional regulator
MAQARATSTDQVIAAAARVFLARGYQASTVDDIAREANISKPTVYQYVESKQWLLDRIVGLVSEDLERCERVVHTADAPANVRLHWLIQLHVTFAVHYRNSYRVTFSEQAALSRGAREEFRRWAKTNTANFVDLLSECRRQGTFDWPGDIEVAANLIMSTLTASHRWFHPVEQLSNDVLVEHIVHLFSGVYQAPQMSDWPMPELPISPLDQPSSDEADLLVS